MQAVVVLVLKTRSFRAFHIDHMTVARPACQTWGAIPRGGSKSQREKSPTGMVVPSLSHTLAASKKRCLPVSCKGHAAHTAEGAQLLEKRLACVLSLSMSTRYEKIRTLVGSLSPQDVQPNPVLTK
jgi:hypothetical protein